MKKGNTIEQLLKILEDETSRKQLLDDNLDCSFLGGTFSKEKCLKEFSRLLHSTTFIMKENHKFDYLPLIMKILNGLYLEKMKEDPFIFYNNKACLELLNLLEKYPTEMKPFRDFLSEIRFEQYQAEVGKFYHNQMKKNRILNDFELKDFLNYLMIYKNRTVPHHYLRYLFYVIFQKDHKLELSKEVYAELFRFLILDFMNQLGLEEKAHIVTLEEKKPFIYQGPDIYINITVMKGTLEGNLSFFPYLFDLFEKRYKYKSFAHNKYEEIKSKKQYTLKEILGSNFFYENFSYLSIEKDIVDQSLIDRLRFFEEVAPSLYQEIIEDYEKQILKTVSKYPKPNSPTHFVLTMNDLLDQTVLLSPEIIENRDYLQMEYHKDGTRKKIAELLASYENELALSKRENKEEHLSFARYYKKTILTSSLNISKLVDEFALLLAYSVKFPETESLLERIFRVYLVSEINDNICNHMLSQTELEVLLSKLNEYMLKYYAINQKKISKFLTKDPGKWNMLNNHLARLYKNVNYMTSQALYESSYLQLTQVLDIEDAKKIQKKVLKKKLISQRIYMLVLIILILIFSTSLFLLGRIFVQYWHANDSYGKVQEKMSQTKPVPIITPDPNRTEFPMNDDIPQLDFAPLKEENDEVVAWIRIDDTEINYPVVQGTDNEFYLNHLYNKKSNVSGSIFEDYRNGDDFSYDNTVLYGHNLRNNTMFGSLKKYKDASYFENHKYVWLITPNATYQYEIFAAYEFDSSKEQYIFNFNSEESFQTYLDGIKNRSVLSSELKVSPKDHLLTLSTCVEEVNAKRFIVIAKRMVQYVK